MGNIRSPGCQCQDCSAGECTGSSCNDYGLNWSVHIDGVQQDTTNAPAGALDNDQFIADMDGMTINFGSLVDMSDPFVPNPSTFCISGSFDKKQGATPFPGNYDLRLLNTSTSSYEDSEASNLNAWITVGTTGTDCYREIYFLLWCGFKGNSSESTKPHSVFLSTLTTITGCARSIDLTGKAVPKWKWKSGSLCVEQVWANPILASSLPTITLSIT